MSCYKSNVRFQKRFKDQLTSVIMGKVCIWSFRSSSVASLLMITSPSRTGNTVDWSIWSLHLDNPRSPTKRENNTSWKEGNSWNYQSRFLFSKLINICFSPNQYEDCSFTSSYVYLYVLTCCIHGKCKRPKRQESLYPSVNFKNGHTRLFQSHVWIVLRSVHTSRNLVRNSHRKYYYRYS